VEANKVLARILSHRNARHQLRAEEEQIRIYEDRESYRQRAIKLWKNYMESIQRSTKFRHGRDSQEAVLRGYYSVGALLLQYSQMPKVKAANKEDAR